MATDGGGSGDNRYSTFALLFPTRGDLGGERIPPPILRGGRIHPPLLRGARAPPGCTSYTSEVVGLCEAIRFLLTLLDLDGGRERIPSSLIFLIDCDGLVEGLANPYTRFCPLLDYIRRGLNRLGEVATLQVQWCPSHMRAGPLPNRIADRCGSALRGLGLLISPGWETGAYAWRLGRKDLARLAGESWDSDFGDPPARGAQRGALSRRESLAGGPTVRVLLRQLRRHPVAQWGAFCVMLKTPGAGRVGFARDLLGGVGGSWHCRRCRQPLKASSLSPYLRTAQARGGLGWHLLSDCGKADHFGALVGGALSDILEDHLPAFLKKLGAVLGAGPFSAEARRKQKEKVAEPRRSEEETKYYKEGACLSAAEFVATLPERQPLLQQPPAPPSRSRSRSNRRSHRVAPPHVPPLVGGIARRAMPSREPGPLGARPRVQRRGGVSEEDEELGRRLSGGVGGAAQPVRGQERIGSSRVAGASSVPPPVVDRRLGRMGGGASSEEEEFGVPDLVEGGLLGLPIRGQARFGGARVVVADRSSSPRGGRVDPLLRGAGRPPSPLAARQSGRVVGRFTPPPRRGSRPSRSGSRSRGRRGPYPAAEFFEEGEGLDLRFLDGDGSVMQPARGQARVGSSRVAGASSAFPPAVDRRLGRMGGGDSSEEEEFEAPVLEDDKLSVHPKRGQARPGKARVVVGGRADPLPRRTGHPPPPAPARRGGRAVRRAPPPPRRGSRPPRSGSRSRGRRGPAPVADLFEEVGATLRRWRVEGAEAGPAPR